jgi:hypothetical protein
VTHVPFEGRTSPVSAGPQGDKLDANVPTDVPKAVPLAALRLGDRLVVTVPGEMTAEMGRRVRTAVLATARSAGVRRAVISGLANEYLQYFTTPEEYDRQHYEGGSTLYGRASSELLKESLVRLTGSLVKRVAAPPPYPYDPRNGLAADQPPFSSGAAHASAMAQPSTTQRLERAVFSWQGGLRGLDRPLDRAFVTIERHTGRGWRAADSDLGLDILWDVDENGIYRAFWEVPRSAKRGRYRFVVTGNRYGLRSRPFEVVNSTSVRVRPVAGGVVLSYKPAVVEQDLTWRPPIHAGRVMFRVANHPYVVHVRGGRVFKTPKGSGSVIIPAGAARDRYGNRNTKPLTVRP